MAKTKNQIISVPTAQEKTKAYLPTPTKSTRTLTKPRSVRSKENTLAYYNCLIEKIANPSNQKTKITQVAHHCKCNKGQVAIAQQEHKQQLLKAVAKDYKSFGQSLGHYLQADVIGCLQDNERQN